MRRWPRDQTIKAFIGRFTRSSTYFSFDETDDDEELRLTTEEDVVGVETPGDEERGETGSSFDEFECGPPVEEKGVDVPTDRCAGTNKCDELSIQLFDGFVDGEPRCVGTGRGES